MVTRARSRSRRAPATSSAIARSLSINVGALTEEREAGRILALFRLGDARVEEGREARVRLLREHTSSPQAACVRAVCSDDPGATPLK
jgi:hypothetical protein